MSIGRAESADWPSLLTLWLNSFSDGAEYWEWFRGRVWRPEETLVLREDGRIVSCLLLLPCTFSGGLRAQYVYAVATLPSARGGGRAGRLLAAAEKYGREQGLDLSVLLTEEDSLQAYYGRFGYRPVCEAAVRLVPAVPPRGTPRRMEERDLPVVAALYARACENVTAVCRGGEHWQLQLELYGKNAAVAEYEGNLTAYCFYDARGVQEAAGPEAAALAGTCAEGGTWMTVPDGPEGRTAIGCALPLSERGAAALSDGPLYLNLMYN